MGACKNAARHTIRCGMVLCKCQQMSAAHLPRREKTAPMKVPGGTPKPSASIVTSIGNDSLATGLSINPRCNLIAVAIVVVRSNSNSASNQFFFNTPFRPGCSVFGCPPPPDLRPSPPFSALRGGAKWPRFCGFGGVWMPNRCDRIRERDARVFIASVD